MDDFAPICPLDPNDVDDLELAETVLLWDLGERHDEARDERDFEVIAEVEEAWRRAQLPRAGAGGEPERLDARRERLLGTVRELRTRLFPPARRRPVAPSRRCLPWSSRAAVRPRARQRGSRRRACRSPGRSGPTSPDPDLDTGAALRGLGEAALAHVRIGFRGLPLGECGETPLNAVTTSVSPHGSGRPPWR
jgi:hypothetical protein